MNPKISMSNHSFDLLAGSSEFLNAIINNISSCVLLLDKHMSLIAYNDPLKTIFSNKKDEDLLYQRCGEAIGCAYQIEEGVECGKTTKCRSCELRVAALDSYVNNEVIFKKRIQKPFLSYDGQKVNKDLQFSTRLFSFDDEKYIIMIVDDITSLLAS